MNRTVACVLAGFGKTSAVNADELFTWPVLHEILHASVRNAELPQSLVARTVMLPPVDPHNTEIDAPFAGPRMSAPAGTAHVYDVAPVDPVVA